MKRRKALSSISAIAGGVTILPQIFLSGCSHGPYPYSLFEWGDMELLNDFSEVIIPATPEIPGAKAANVGNFIQLYVTDCYNSVNQKIFLEGFKKFKLEIKNRYGKDFTKLKPEEKVSIIEKLDTESSTNKQELSHGNSKDFYELLKRTALFGYFTSEIGATKSLRYLPIPGYQKGEIPYQGEKAWAL